MLAVFFSCFSAPWRPPRGLQGAKIFQGAKNSNFNFGRETLVDWIFRPPHKNVQNWQSRPSHWTPVNWIWENCPYSIPMGMRSRFDCCMAGSACDARPAALEDEGHARDRSLPTVSMCAINCCMDQVECYKGHIFHRAGLLGWCRRRQSSTQLCRRRRDRQSKANSTLLK